MDYKIWLQEKIAEEIGGEAKNVFPDEDFENFNLDSLAMVSLSFEIEKLLGKEISPTVFTEYNTINKLATTVITFSRVAFSIFVCKH